MKRRFFIAALAGSYAALRAVSVVAATRPRIAVLALNTLESDNAFLAGFRDELVRLGYIEGKTADIDYRSAAGDTAALKPLAQTLLALKPDVALADTPSAAIAMHTAAPPLPIVCPTFSDAVIPSLAASYAHPGGSVTGSGVSVEGVTAKLVELTLEALPGVARIGFLANPAGTSMAMYQQQIEAAARSRHVPVVVAKARSGDEIDGAIEQLGAQGAAAFIVPANALLQAHGGLIAAAALRQRLPSVFTMRSYVEAGGMLSYGVDETENYRRAADYIDKIIKGAVPGDLPIEFPTKLDLAVNLKTAKALGVTMPESILLRADEVIE